jgi:hypothetical protein
VGDGTGSAVGSLFVVGCDDNDSRDKMNPAPPYSLDPQFFAGEPIEDVCPPPGVCTGPRQNRLVIRLQHTGNKEEITDTLYVDVQNSYKVAQCLRGQTKGGAPQWDTRVLTAADGSPIPGMLWCDWNAADQPAADGGAPDASAADAGALDAGVVGDGGVPIVMTSDHARINLSTQDFVQVSLAPRLTCVEARSVAVALPGSWIDFQDFGLAIQAAAPPEARDTVSGDFKVDFGQRLRASFHLVLGDQAVSYAEKTHDLIPDQRIGGAIDGFFDFDLERGRAAQPFP